MTSTDDPTTLDPTRHLDARRRELVDAARRAALREPDLDGPGLPEALRSEIAAVVTGAAGLEPGTGGTPGDQQRWSQPEAPSQPELPFRTRAEALAFAEQMATDPTSLQERDLDHLRAAGMSPAQTVAVGQVVGFSAFQARLEMVARALDEQSAAAPPEGDLVQAPEELPHPRSRFAMRGWVGWLPLGGRDEDFPSGTIRSPTTPAASWCTTRRRAPTARPCTTSCEPTD